jgi:SAM-dependent methyltransferase
MKSTLKILFRFVTFTTLQFGLNIYRPLRFIQSLPKYVSNILSFKKNYKGKFELLPCLHDWYEEGGNAKSEYFLQDLYIARFIFDAKPINHLDIGSSVEGFVAHVASFRTIEVLDVRPITSVIPGVIFKTSDLSKPIDETLCESYDSVSCLHALEHFGLGRYGDPIDVNGHIKGIENMAKILKPSGTFYLSVPIGIERVEFNANRVFDPVNIIEIARQFNLKLVRFGFIENSIVKFYDQLIDIDFQRLSNIRYSLGIFIFEKE